MFNRFKKKAMNYQNIDVQKFEELMKTEDAVVLDVRSPGELAEGSIPCHIMINFFEPGFKDKIAQLNKSKTYLVYCRSGNRSGQACALMASLGFEKLYNLVGGIGAWNAAHVTS